ncbi:MAG: NTP transferase domain-containing protein, partial [Opitutaceae bacterium]
MTEATPPEPAAERPFPCGLIILAAGASTRMGQPKQLLEVGGQPLLLRAVAAALAAPVWPVVVVLGAHAAVLRPLLAPQPVLVVENAAWAEGMASSLREGVAALAQFSRRLEAAVVVLADQPALDAAVIRRLIAAHHASGRALVAARDAGAADNHPGGTLMRRLLLLSVMIAACQAHPGASGQDARIARVVGNLQGPVVVEGEPATGMPLADRMAHHRVPGVSIAVVDGGVVAWARGFGVREIGTTDTITPETRFQAASISKPVAVTGMLRLVDAGRLDLDADVNTYLTSWRVPSSP